nr:MAG TPA: hypothetical protein [Caudoviricetes sp.]
MISAKTARERACATNANVETTLEAIEEDVTAATDRGLFSTTVTFVVPQDDEEETIALLEATCETLKRLGYTAHLCTDDFNYDYDDDEETVEMPLFISWAAK